MKCKNCNTLLPEFRRFERRICQNCGAPVHMPAPPKKQAVAREAAFEKTVSDAQRTLNRCQWCIIAATVSLMVFILCALLFDKLDMPTLLPAVIGFLSLLIFAPLAVVFLLVAIVKGIKQRTGLDNIDLTLTFFFCLAVSMSFILLTNSIINNIYYNNHQDQFVQIEANISKIVTETDEDGDEDHDVYITFTLDETIYQDVEYPHYSSSMAQGDTVTVTVDPNDPEELPQKQTTMIYVSAAALVLFSACLYFLPLRRLLKEK